MDSPVVGPPLLRYLTEGRYIIEVDYGNRKYHSRSNPPVVGENSGADFDTSVVATRKEHLQRSSVFFRSSPCTFQCGGSSGIYFFDSSVDVVVPTVYCRSGWSK
jgi:hypothetical protein